MAHDEPLSAPDSQKGHAVPFHVDSEVGQLRQVIVHRPGLELDRLTPENIGDLLFDTSCGPTGLEPTTTRSSVSCVSAA